MLAHCEVRELIGKETLEAVVVEDTETAERRTLPARALFVFIGADPHTEWLRDHVALDDGGYILTGADAAVACAASEASSGSAEWLAAVTTLARDHIAGRLRRRRRSQRFDAEGVRRGG